MSVAAQRKADVSDETSSPFYFNASHWRAMDGVMEGVRERSGIMVMTGPTGSGKTMLMRAIADGLEMGATPLFLQYASLNFREFVNFLHTSLKVSDEIVDASNKAVALRKFLYAQAERDETAVVFIDEAQNLEPDVLKMLPKLAGFDTLEDGRVVGMQFVLVGGAELREFLDDADFDDVRGAIARSYELRFFTREELKHFLEKRLAPIARMTPEPITDDAIEAVGKYTGGSPRLIGMICSHAMLFAAEHPGRSIDEAMIEEAAEALMIEPVENAFAHEDDEFELTGPFSSADLKGEEARTSIAAEESGDDADIAAIAEESGAEYDDRQLDQTAEAYADETLDGETDQDVYASTDVLDDIGGHYVDDLEDEFVEANPDGSDASDSGAGGSILGKIKSAVTSRRSRAAKAGATKVLGAGRKSRSNEAAPVAKRQMKTRVAGDRERKIKIGIMAAAFSGLAFGAYMVRGPVIDALASVKTAVSTTASRTAESVSGVAAATVEIVKDATTSAPEDTSVVATRVEAPGSATAPAIAAPPIAGTGETDTAEATAPAIAVGGWGATVKVEKAAEPVGGAGPSLPAPAVDMARGALDLVDRAIEAGAASAPESVRGAFEQASNDVASLRRTVTTSGKSADDVRARANEIVAKADDQFEKQLYIAPRGENAYESYRKALDIDPENEAALRGVEKLRAFYSTKAENARKAKQWDKANRHFETALAISRLRPVR